MALRRNIPAILLLLALPVFGEKRDREYRVKAEFLFNFLNFVDWPNARPADAPWVIGVLGHDPFGDVLDQTVRGKLVHGRPVEIRRYGRRGSVRDCDILFISGTDFDRMAIPSAPGLLTVGEAPGFLRSGGIVNFYLEGDRVHFEVRLDAARAARLQMSSRLLKLGRTL